MNLTELQNQLIGHWAGTNLLRLSWLTPSDFVSPSKLTVKPVTNGRFLTFTYTWVHENKAHEGLILLGYHNEQESASAAWVDSWHQNSSVMLFQGMIDEQGKIDVRGSYAAPEGPDWGWRIIIEVSTPDALQLLMFNCSPAGDEELAVQADYSRL